MLRRQGWDVVYLGANVPLDRMEASVEQIKPLLVILPAQTLTAAANLLPMARKLQEINIPLAYGGTVFNNIPAVVEAIPGHFLGNELDQVPQVIEKLLQEKPPISKMKPVSKAYEAAYDHFVEQRSAIEAQLHQSPAISGMPTTLLKTTNQEFGDNLEAALRLGDLNMVTINLEWVKGLILNNHERLPETSLAAYLNAYQQAVMSEMDDRAAPLQAWFAQQN